MHRILAYIMSFIIIALLLSNNIDSAVGNYIENQSPYYLSFASIGAISLESRLDCWAKINTTSSTAQLRTYLKDIIKDLDLSSNENNINISEDSDSYNLQYHQANGLRQYEIIMKSDNKNMNTYIITTVLSREKNPDLRVYEQKLRKNTHLAWNYYYLYSGVINELIDKNGVNQIINTILKIMQAAKIDTYDDERTRAVTAYTKHITTAFKDGSKVYNLQIAVRMNKADHKTYVWIGSPLIHTAY